MCKNWQMNGECKLGEKCSFAHGEEELRTKNHLPSNFKTKTCNNFHNEGTCQYGDRCQFLHSIYDLNAYKLSWRQGLKEGGRLTLQRIQQQGADVQPAFVNLVTGTGGGAPKKRLACFEQIYNKEDYHKNNFTRSKNVKAKRY